MGGGGETRERHVKVDDRWVLVMSEGTTALTTTSSSSINEWVLDSGATHHMCLHIEYFSELRPVGDITSIRTGSSERLTVKGVGSVPTVRKCGTQLKFTSVFYVPSLHLSLLSVFQPHKKGVRVEFADGGCALTKGEKTLLRDTSTASTSIKQKMWALCFGVLE